jgi:hypothetical protein
MLKTKTSTFQKYLIMTIEFHLISFKEKPRYLSKFDWGLKDKKIWAADWTPLL